MAADLAVRTSEDLFPRSRRGKIRPCPHCQARRRSLRWTALIIVLLLVAGVLLSWPYLAVMR